LCRRRSFFLRSWFCFQTSDSCSWRRRAETSRFDEFSEKFLDLAQAEDLALLLRPAAQDGEYLVPTFIDEFIDLGALPGTKGADTPAYSIAYFRATSLEFPSPSIEVDFRLIVYVFLQETDLEPLDAMGEHRHAILSDIEKKKSDEVYCYK
jgi:hypothetical protein